MSRNRSTPNHLTLPIYDDHNGKKNDANGTSNNNSNSPLFRYNGGGIDSPTNQHFHYHNMTTSPSSTSSSSSSSPTSRNSGSRTGGHYDAVAATYVCHHHRHRKHHNVRVIGTMILLCILYFGLERPTKIGISSSIISNDNDGGERQMEYSTEKVPTIVGGDAGATGETIQHVPKLSFPNTSPWSLVLNDYTITELKSSMVVEEGIITVASSPSPSPLQQLVTQQQPQSLLSKEEKEDGFVVLPKICWLMSFPNSGTSFTMTMVSRSSNMSYATNYGEEVTSINQNESLPIYPTTIQPEGGGPYWRGTHNVQINGVHRPRNLPQDYVLTKTHCSGRCVHCGPSDYIETPEMFLQQCASGHAYVSPTREFIDVQYPTDHVKKAIHLIRNPFHNIIARFHLTYKRHLSSNKTDWLEQHPNNADGFRAWCNDLDNDYAEMDRAYFLYRNDSSSSLTVHQSQVQQEQPGIGEIILDAPCHGEFYKYTQWHNLVHESLALLSGGGAADGNDNKEEHHLRSPYSAHPPQGRIPVHTVYYEEYTTNYNETANGILNFINLKPIHSFPKFHARTDYDNDYFTKSEQEQVKQLIHMVASPKVWDQIQHYF